VRNLIFSPKKEFLFISPCARSQSVKCDVEWCNDPRSVVLEDSYKQFQRWLCAACVGRQAFEHFLRTSEPDGNRLSLSATVLMSVADPAIDEEYMSKGFIEDLKHDLEKIFHPISYKIGDSLTEPPINVPNTGFNSLYATIANVKVQDGRAQFELTLQRDPSKPLLNSPYRMVQDLMALVTDPESLLYAPPAGYWTDDDAFAQSSHPLSPKKKVEEEEGAPEKPKGLRLLNTSHPYNPPVLLELLTIKWGDCVGAPARGPPKGADERALGSNLLWGSVSWLNALEPPPEVKEKKDKKGRGKKMENMK